jgi:hypothetical protein
MWVYIAVCKLVAMNVGSLAASVGSQPFIFARIAGSKRLLFASPRDLVCGPLHLAPAEAEAHEPELNNVLRRFAIRLSSVTMMVMAVTMIVMAITMIVMAMNVPMMSMAMMVPSTMVFIRVIAWLAIRVDIARIVIVL